MTKDELLEALLVERQDQTWWKRPPRYAQLETWDDDRFIDDDVTCARRRKEADEEWLASEGRVS